MTKNGVAQAIGGAVAVFAIAIVVAACGGGSTKAIVPGTTTTTDAGRAARQAATAAYRQCLQTHGVTLPAGGGFGGRGAGGGTGGSVPGSLPTTTIPAGVTPQQYQAALAACARLLPARGAGGGGNLQNNPQFQVYYNCLQTYLMTHGGTTLPPLSQGGGGLFGGGGGAGGGAGGASTATTDPRLQAARDHCASLRPAFGAGATTTTVK